MKIYLVRHGKARKRSAWAGADDLRPLAAKGEAQAHGIQAALESVLLGAIYSSPAVRCRQTLEPLAADRTLRVETDPRLAAGAGVEGALELLDYQLDHQKGAPIVICASRHLIIELLLELGVGGDDPASLRCQKGGAWVIDRKGAELVDAEYLPPRSAEPEAARLERCAVLDVGSTSMSLLVADIAPKEGRIETVLRTRAELRLGVTPERITEASRERVLEAGAAMRVDAESVGARVLLPVATASLRDAANGPELAERLGCVLDTEVRQLSGLEEAGIVYEAARGRLGLHGSTVLSLDLGGGSLDLAVGPDGGVSYRASEALGVTRLHAELVHHDPMSAREIAAIRERVISGLRPHVESVARHRPLHCVVAGGTVRAMAKVVRANRALASTGIAGCAISRWDMVALAVALASASHAERLDMPGVSARRADLLPTGAIILASLLDTLDLPELLVCDWGLREGVLLERMRSQG